MAVVKLYNRVTRQIIEVDSVAGRFHRLRRRIFAWADACEKLGIDKECQMVMITLTYADVDGWRPRHVTEFIKKLRGVWTLRSYAWVAELQKRGALHYHLLAWVEKPYRRIKPDKEGIWTHGHTKTEKARTPYYLCKYTQKGFGENESTRRFPVGARICSTWFDASLRAQEQANNWRLSVYPRWLVDWLSDSGLSGWPRRLVGGGWCVGAVQVASPYRFVSVEH